MKQKTSVQWELNKAIAAAILKDRVRRRRLLGYLAFAMLGVFALGLWVIDGWLAESLLRFGLFWLGCGLLCLFVMMFALFDAVSAVKEERDKIEREED